MPNGGEGPGEKHALSEMERQTAAAFIIQRSFRCFINVRIYKYYRNLVNFRHRGDPGLLLRCINPQEAALCQDRASGAVVRFRLGGSIFPPIVYYKIFLRASVQDIGSFAPRDYTVGKPTQHYLLQRHNDAVLSESRSARVKDVTLTDVTNEVEKTNWYNRFENNGWRPIANKHLHIYDAVTQRTARHCRPDFHHVAETRKLQQTKAREKRKEAWMMRMLGTSRTSGASEPDQGVRVNLEAHLGALDSGVGVVPEEGEEQDMERWLSTLDFDDYFNHWFSLATSVTAADLVHGQHLFAQGSLDSTE